MLFNIKSQQIQGLTKSSFEITTGCSQNQKSFNTNRKPSYL